MVIGVHTGLNMCFYSLTQYAIVGRCRIQQMEHSCNATIQANGECLDINGTIVYKFSSFVTRLKQDCSI